MIIEIPYKTPTVNHLYWHRGNVKIMKKEAKVLRDKIVDIVEQLTFPFALNSELDVTIEVFENWYTKDGLIKKKDISNREKFLIDSVFKALNVDDRNIFKTTLIKRQSMNKEHVIINICELQEKN